MRTPYRATLALTVVLLVATACAFGGDDPGAGPSPASPSPSAPPTASRAPSSTASPSPSGGNATLPEGLRTEPAVAAAIADTAERAKVDPDQVVIAAWSPVTFTDGSMGCPKKGMSYTQSLIEGELLLLRVDASLYQYHAATGKPFTYCATPAASYTVGG